MHLIKDNISFTAGKLDGEGGLEEGWRDQWCPCGNIPNAPPNSDEEFEQKHRRKRGAGREILNMQK